MLLSFQSSVQLINVYRLLRRCKFGLIGGASSIHVRLESEICFSSIFISVLISFSFSYQNFSGVCE